jgi:hypothetical protein
MKRYILPILLLLLSNCLFPGHVLAETQRSNRAWELNYDNLTEYNESRLYSGYITNSTDENETVTLSVSISPIEAGIVPGQGEFEWGSEVTLFAVAEEGWKFENWTQDDEIISTSNPYVFIIFSDTQITANFTDEWAEISVSLDTLYVDSDAGEMIEKEVTISNSGTIPLEFVLSIVSADIINNQKAIAKTDDSPPYQPSAPKNEDTAAGSVKSDITSGGPDFFGYHWMDSDNPKGPEFLWNSISATGTLLKEISGCDDCTQEVDLSFDFYFYGNDYKKIYVDANGYISVADGFSSYLNTSLPSGSAPAGIIAGYWRDLNPGASINSNIFFQDFGYYAVIEFSSVRLLEGSNTVTFQFHLYKTGEIRIYYLSVPGQNNYTIGIQNPGKNDGLLIAYNVPYIKNNHAIKITAIPLWVDFEPKTGSIQPQDSQNVIVYLDAETLVDGKYEAFMQIQSNDFTKPVVTVPIILNVTGIPGIELSDHTIDLGITGINHEKEFNLTVNNPGSATLIITNIQTSGSGFIVSDTILEIPPGQSRTLLILFSGDEEIIYEETLSFNTNVPDNETFSIPLRAEVLKLDASFSVMDETMNPLTGALVNIYDGNDIIFSGNTDHDGFLLVENLFPGTFTYNISKDDYADSTGTLVISDALVEINITMKEQFIRFYIVGDQIDYESGIDEYIPVRLEVKGFGDFTYSIYIKKNDSFFFETSENLSATDLKIIDYSYQIKPDDPPGIYGFFLTYNSLNPLQMGELDTRNFNLINPSELIDIYSPGTQDIIYAGETLEISWNSFNIPGVNIYYALGNDDVWVPILLDRSTHNSFEYGLNYYFWQIPGDLIDVDTECNIRIESAENADVCDLSGKFQLLGTPVVFINPTENTEIVAGERLDIILDLKHPSFITLSASNDSFHYYWLYSDELPAGRFEYISDTRSFEPGTFRVELNHGLSGLDYYSDQFNILPATGYHLVSFIVDMSQARIDGTRNFDPGYDDVFISGTFHEKWTKPGTNNRYKLLHTENNNYKVTLAVLPGEINYNFYVVPKNETPTWAHGEGDTLNFRLADITKDSELMHSWMNFPIYEIALVSDPPNAGILFGGGLRPAGHMTSILASPNPDFRFVNWTIDENVIWGEQENFEFRMPARNLQIKANFTSTIAVNPVLLKNVNFYPNPADNFIKLSSENIISEIRIFDNTGKVVFVFDNGVENEINQDISFLKPGIYMIRAKSKKKAHLMKLQVIR